MSCGTGRGPAANDIVREVYMGGGSDSEDGSEEESEEGSEEAEVEEDEDEYVVKAYIELPFSELSAAIVAPRLPLKMIMRFSSVAAPP